MLAVSELAYAAGQSESLVRQHIHRGHLTATKVGSRTVISPDEALRWCRDRGFPFAPPPGLAEAVTVEPRSARMTVVARKDSDTSATNVYTLIRHRRAELVGPWPTKLRGEWTTEELGEGFVCLTADAPLDQCRQLADQAISQGSVNLAGLDCYFELLDAPRRHWAFRDKRPGVDASIISPFSEHSAEVIEYWSADTERRGSLHQAVSDLPYDFPLQVSSSFSLRTRPDRLGNLAIIGAKDTLTCDLQVDRSDGTITFHASGDQIAHGAYTVSVWASHGGDDLLRSEYPVTLGSIPIALPSTPDRIGFAVHQTSDGQCVDLFDCYLIVQVGIDLSVSSGPVLQLTDDRRRPIHTVEKSAIRSRLLIEGDKHAPDLDRAIRRRSLQRNAAERDAEARRAGNLARFDPQHFVDAVAHLTKLIRQDADISAPIYIADRYFVNPIKGSLGVQLYADLLAASSDRSLNVLCTEPPSCYPRPWWMKLPSHLTRHLTVRSFLRQDGSAAFHDRYLVAGDRETLFTNSFKGWPHDGVTFVNLPFNVYRTQAINLWSLALRSSNAPFFVEEYPR